MGVPKRKVSKARQGERRSHLAISAPPLVECEHCHELKRAHHVCPTCGWYNGPRGGRRSSRSRRPKASSSNDRCASRSMRWEATTPLAKIVRGAIDYATGTAADEVILVGDVPRLEARARRRRRGRRPANLRLVDAPRGHRDGGASRPQPCGRSGAPRSSSPPTSSATASADAVVSAGSTGATMAAAVFRLGRIDGIDRPALPAHMVTDDRAGHAARRRRQRRLRAGEPRAVRGDGRDLRRARARRRRTPASAC